MAQRPTEQVKCEGCGIMVPDWDAYERQGKVYGRCCVTATAERRAYEKWFVEPNA